MSLMNCRVLYLALLSSIQAFDCIKGSQSNVAPNSQPQVLDISSHTRLANDPDYYRLAYLDRRLIPAHLLSDLSKLLPDNKEPIKQWLNKKLLEDVTQKNTQALISIEKVNLPDDPVCYLVTMTDVRQTAKSELLTARLGKGRLQKSAEALQEYVCSLILFPLDKDNNQALAYLLGKWTQLVNASCIVPDWGLRVLASPSLFADAHHIKALSKNNILGSNPTKTLISTKKTTTLQNFGLEEGIDCIVLLRILPCYSIRHKTAARVIEGARTLTFYLPEGSDENSPNTLRSLWSMAQYMQERYQHSSMHKDLIPYIPQEVTDPQLIDALNQKLEELVSTPEAEYTVFPVDSVWRPDRYGKGAQFLYTQGTNARKSPYLLKSLRDAKELKLSSLVTLSNEKGTKSGQEALGGLIFTLPLEHENKFYYFRTGRWFNVDSSRFAAIIRKLRNPEVKKTLDPLVPYTEDDAKKKEDKEYQELRYNKRLVDQWTSHHEEPKILLLDRLCVQLDSSEDVFELADILLYDTRSKEIHVIHVKRKESGDLDHHRSQVERSAEFLATNLKRSQVMKILLRAFFKAFKRRFNLTVQEVKRRGQLFVKNSKDDSIDDLLKIPEKSAKSGISQCKIAVKSYLEKNGKKAFKGNERLLALIGDWLYGTELYAKENEKENIELFFDRFTAELAQKDSLFKKLTSISDDDMKELIGIVYECKEQEKECKEQEKECKEEEKECKEQEKFDSFMKGLSQLIALKNLLLTPGVISENTKKKITIVMAVIDDRAIAHKKTDRSKEEALFRKQHLW